MVNKEKDLIAEFCDSVLCESEKDRDCAFQFLAASLAEKYPDPEDAIRLAKEAGIEFVIKPQLRAEPHE